MQALSLRLLLESELLVPIMQLTPENKPPNTLTQVQVFANMLLHNQGRGGMKVSAAVEEKLGDSSE